MDFTKFFDYIKNVDINTINTLQIDNVKFFLDEFCKKIDQRSEYLKLDLKYQKNKLKLNEMVGVVFSYKLNHFITTSDFLYIHITINKIINIVFRRLCDCNQFYVESKLTKRIYFHTKGNQLIFNDSAILDHYQKYHTSVLSYDNLKKIVNLLIDTYSELNEFKNLNFLLTSNWK